MTTWIHNAGKNTAAAFAPVYSSPHPANQVPVLPRWPHWPHWPVFSECRIQRRITLLQVSITLDGLARLRLRDIQCQRTETETETETQPVQRHNQPASSQPASQ